MVSLSSKKRMAASVMGVGIRRVRLDPQKVEDLQDAITRDDIRALIQQGVIWGVRARGVSRGRARRRAGRKRGAGSRKGPSGARAGQHGEWATKVRTMRNYLKDQKRKARITTSEFRRLCLKVKGGQLTTVGRLREMVTQMSRRV